MLVYPIDRGEGKESKMVQCSRQRRKQCCEGKGSDTRSRQPSLRLSLECRGTRTPGPALDRKSLFRRHALKSDLSLYEYSPFLLGVREFSRP